MLTRPLSSLFLSCSQSYLQAASDGPASHGLDPSANYNSPKFRSRNQSYMRAVSTLSQASCVSQVGPPPGQPPAADSGLRQVGPLASWSAPCCRLRPEPGGVPPLLVSPLLQSPSQECSCAITALGSSVGMTGPL